jgi:hypothetical protein
MKMVRAAEKAEIMAEERVRLGDLLQADCGPGLRHSISASEFAPLVDYCSFWALPISTDMS